ncbi:DUF445 domain-containing protein [Pelagibius sp. 7325]|uniref:DUF445 domain-containing protein n=1 Tax=Pelagibius sp. 7325 TaxID=3131994 RepID=UPI0030ED6111
MAYSSEGSAADLAGAAGSDAADQRRALRRHRGVATALLVVMGSTYAGATWFGSTYGVDGFWIDLLRAGTEAALVGGLADWFAVTALFRRPLGLPIPHTAVIPRNKDRIGQGLGRFIERNFLEPKLVAARLREAGVSRRLGLWLSEKENADLVADRLVVVLAFVFRSLNDQKMARLMQVMLRRRLGETELAPVLAALVDVLRRNGMHQQLFDTMLDAVARYLAAHKHQIHQVVEERSDWWIPKRVDRRVAEAITAGLEDYLQSLRDRDHAARDSFDAAIARLVDDLRRSPAHRARVNALRDRLLETPQLSDYTATLWQSLRGGLEEELAAPHSRLRQALSGALRSLGSAVADDPEVQARMDRRIEEAAVALVEPWRKDIGQFVADVVRGWETATVVERVELAVGRDLQYIRVNGTLVGAVVGCLLFLATEYLF